MNRDLKKRFDEISSFDVAMNGLPEAVAEKKQYDIDIRG